MPVSFGTWRFDSSQPHRRRTMTKLLAYWLNAYNSTLRESARRRSPAPATSSATDGSSRRATHRRDGLDYTLDEIEHGLLRGNRRPPYGLRRLLRPGDPKLDAAPGRADPRIHFALNCGARSCPPVRTYTADGVDAELEAATLSYMEAESDLDRERGVLTLPGRGQALPLGFRDRRGADRACRPRAGRRGRGMDTRARGRDPRSTTRSSTGSSSRPPPLSRRRPRGARAARRCRFPP